MLHEIDSASLEKRSKCFSNTFKYFQNINLGVVRHFKKDPWLLCTYKTAFKKYLCEA